MDDSTPAVVRSAFSTADPEVAEHFIRDAYVDNNLVLDGDRAAFTFGHTTLGGPGFAINRLRAQVAMSFDAGSTSDDPLLVITPVDGHLSYVDSAYRDVHVDGGSPVLVPPLGGMRAVCVDMEEILVPLDREEVAAHAEATIGIDARDLVFEGLEPITAARGRHWNATVAHVRDDVLGDAWAARHPILLDQAFRTLASALLSTFPNTALARSRDPEGATVRGDVPAATLRDVVDYIDTHADRPVRPADLAALTGRPSVEIVESFRRQDRHPAELLWDARLRGVRRALLDAGPDATDGTVPALAARWGFGRLDRFRAAYLRAFGESPEDTLGR